MTTIDHQQAAVRAMAHYRFADDTPCEDGCACEMTEIADREELAGLLAAATPHLRAGIAEEVRNLRSQFHDDAKTAFGRIGPSTEAYLNALDDVLALLEGGGE